MGQFDDRRGMAWNLNHLGDIERKQGGRDRPSTNLTFDQQEEPCTTSGKAPSR